MFLQMAGFPSVLRLNYYSIVYVYAIHSSVDRHLGCFHILAIVNNVSVSMRMQISLQDIDFNLGQYISRNGIAG